MQEFGSLEFTMYCIRAETFLNLKAVLMHEDALERGCLVEFCQDLGSSIFISHQWLSCSHPDPHGEQLQVMQKALRNIMTPRTRQMQISPHMGSEMFRCPQPVNYASKMQRKPLLIWYDYMSIPQKEENRQQRCEAIRSIPFYVARCDFFVALCPSCIHLDTHEKLSQYTWAERGWCRAERMARELSSDDGMIVCVEGAAHQTLLPDRKRKQAPGEGHFTVPTDRNFIAMIMKQMFRDKLRHLFRMGDLPEYRWYLNQQSTCFRGLNIDPIEDIVPSCPDHGDVVAKFLHQNCFSKINERDGMGYTPICYAAINGDASVLTALLAHGACANDQVSKRDQKHEFYKGDCPLSLSAWFSQHEAMELLLAGKAKPGVLNELRFSPVDFACAADDVYEIRMLINARADVWKEAFLNLNPLNTAAALGSVAVLQELIRQAPTEKLPHLLRHCLHWAMVHGGFAKNLQVLIDARADVNERWETRITQFWAWLPMKYWSFKHRIRQSRLTLLAYHHQGGTPLMFSIINAQFEATRFLVAARADVNLRNSKGSTAADLAQEVSAPGAVISLLRKKRVTEGERWRERSLAWRDSEDMEASLTR